MSFCLLCLTGCIACPKVFYPTQRSIARAKEERTQGGFQQAYRYAIGVSITFCWKSSRGPCGHGWRGRERYQRNEPTTAKHVPVDRNSTRVLPEFWKGAKRQARLRTTESRKNQVQPFKYAHSCVYIYIWSWHRRINHSILIPLGQVGEVRCLPSSSQLERIARCTPRFPRVEARWLSSPLSLLLLMMMILLVCWFHIFGDLTYLPLSPISLLKQKRACIRIYIYIKCFF